MKIKISDFPTFNKEWEKEKMVLKTLRELNLKWPELVSGRFDKTGKPLTSNQTQVVS